MSSHITPAGEVALRYDKITGDRYHSREFMSREWEKMWTKVWHLGGISKQIPEPGDYVLHNFMNESVVMIRQAGGAIRAFYNTCQHRGNRLLTVEEGRVKSLQCPYHGWTYSLDGVVTEVLNPEDFPQGDPCGKLKLKEVACEEWNGLVWYSMDENPVPLIEYLNPVPDLLRNRNIASMERVVWRTLSVETNWKFSPDNFNEAYHVSVVHPQFKPIIDEDYRNTVFEMYPSGHNRMIQKGQPSSNADEPGKVGEPWADLLKSWDLDPDAFEGRAQEGRRALQMQMRKLCKSRGYLHYQDWDDDELTDYFHHTLFPNVTLTATPDGVHMYRTEPHPSDPNKCTFDYWFFAPAVEGLDSVSTIIGERPYEAAEHEFLTYGSEMSFDTTRLGTFLDQDLSVGVTQQQGLNSRGFSGAYLSGQESRVQRFHEVLNDYLES
ncbi:MAG: aromatic ring-hydroxylating dioxygenase subunit alpha [Thiohalomonadaceae bacterium]